MITRDFLLRQIHQMVQVMARVLFLKKNQQHEEALKVLDETFQSQPGLDALVQPGLTREEVLDLSRTETGFSADLAVALADLLKTRGELVRRPAEQRMAFQYALWLYEAAQQQEGAAVPWDLPQRMAWLREQTDGD